MFAALGDPVRLQLLAALARGEPRSIAELGVAVPITRQGVTKHLRVLEAAGLLVSERTGREVRFRCDTGGLSAAEAFLQEVAVGWEGALVRLKRHVAGEG